MFAILFRRSKILDCEIKFDFPFSFFNFYLFCFLLSRDTFISHIIYEYFSILKHTSSVLLQIETNSIDQKKICILDKNSTTRITKKKYRWQKNLINDQSKSLRTLKVTKAPQNFTHFHYLLISFSRSLSYRSIASIPVLCFRWNWTIFASRIRHCQTIALLEAKNEFFFKKHKTNCQLLIN